MTVTKGNWTQMKDEKYPGLSLSPSKTRKKYCTEIVFSYPQVFFLISSSAAYPFHRILNKLKIDTQFFNNSFQQGPFTLPKQYLDFVRSWFLSCFHCAVNRKIHKWSAFEGQRSTLRIWSPSCSPSWSAEVPSWIPAMNIPTSFPPANRRPTLSPFLNLTIFVLGLENS